MIRSKLAVALAALALAGGICSQTPPDDVHVSARSYTPGQAPPDPGLIPVAAVVHDARGRAIGALAQADFHVEEGGKEMPLAAFSMVTRPVVNGRPTRSRAMGICVDDFGNSENNLQRAKAVLRSFLKEGVDPEDRIMIASSFSGPMTELTSDKAKLIGAIDRLQVQATPSAAVAGNVTRITAPVGAPSATPANRNQPASRGGSDTMAGSSAIANEFVAMRSTAMVGNMVTQLSSVPGNRVILLVAPGYTGMAEREEDSVISRAVQNGIVINVLDSKSQMSESKGASEPVVQLPAETFNVDAASVGVEAAMAELAQGTGGLFFHHNSDFSPGYFELGLFPGTTYLLGVRSEDADKKKHKLKVRVQPGEYTVEARPGFFPVPKDPAWEMQREMRAKLDQQLLGGKPVEEFPVKVTYAAEKRPAGGTTVRILMNADIKNVPFTKEKDHHVEKLTFVATLFNAQGQFVAGKEGNMEFTLSDARYQSFVASGVKTDLVMEVPPGAYILCTVAQEGQQGKMSSSMNRVEIP